MKQLSKHDVNKLTASELVKEIPFELVSDGKVIAMVCDVNRLEKDSKASHDVNRLKFSKDAQAKGRLSDLSP